MSDAVKSIDKRNNLIKELNEELSQLRSIEEGLRPERGNFKVKLRVQMKKENKTTQKLLEEWEETQQSIIVKEFKLQKKYAKRIKELPIETQEVLDHTLKYYFELIFIVLKQYIAEIINAIKELECQTKS